MRWPRKSGHLTHWRFVKGMDRIVNWLRRALLELGALVVTAAGIGFLGPLGTYSESGLLDRASHWALLLMGAYILIRPCIWGVRRIARATRLPKNALALWTVVIASIPLAIVWRQVGQNAYRQLDGYTQLVPFALLCALAVLAMCLWAERAEMRLAAQQRHEGGPGDQDRSAVTKRDDGLDATFEPAATPLRDDAALRHRLTRSFQGPVIALQSEDHYVRVHGASGSELVLIRLRDAIVEMGDIPGEQLHRSWWIARHGIAAVERSGRTWSLLLTNGLKAPVARQSVHRLERMGLVSRDSLRATDGK